VYQLYTGTGLQLYETGEIDLTGISRFDADRFLDPGEPMHNELISGVSLCTGYVVFDVTRPPFDDVNVRKAFSMAFDRQKYIDVALQGHALSANGLYPPALPGFNLALSSLPYDPAQARELLKQSKYGGPEGLPPIVFTDSGTGTYISPDVAAMAEMWQQNLDVTITVENLEPDYYLDQVYAGNHGQMISSGWCADYPDPENFADVLFHTGSSQNNAGYSNPQLDALLESARVEQDVARRIAMYQQAEQILVDDAAALWTTHSLSYELVKPYVKGYVFTPIDIPIQRYMWLDGK
jgi:ABC-type oligopeptide transport system substrate-binding subunit